MGHTYHGSGSGGHSNLVEYFGALADMRQDELVPRPRGKAVQMVWFTTGYGNLMRDSRYRDRKAPRMTARRVSRKARELARWKDAAFGA